MLIIGKYTSDGRINLIASTKIKIYKRKILGVVQ